jgi:hypothetical protein
MQESMLVGMFFAFFLDFIVFVVRTMLGEAREAFKGSIEF